MKALTTKQQAALNEIKKGLERSGFDSYLAYTYFKDSWKSRGCHEGISIVELEQLEKKGYIKLHKKSTRKTGVFNPVADSWGYSTEILNVTAELV